MSIEAEVVSVMPMQMERGAPADNVLRTTDAEVEKFLDSKRRALGLQAECPCMGKSDLDAKLQKLSKVTNCSLGLGIHGSDLPVDMCFPLTNPDLAVLGECIRRGGFKSLQAMYLQNQHGYKGTISNLGNPCHMNSFDDAGIEALAEGARVKPLAALKRLRLGRNRFGDAGVAALAKTMAAGGFPSLEELELNATKVTDAGLEALTTALKTRGDGALSNLKTIYLFANDKTTPPAQEALVAVAKEAGVAARFDTSGNQVGIGLLPGVYGGGVNHAGVSAF